MFGLCWQFSDKIQPAPGLDLEIWGTARIYRTLVADHPTGVDDPESSSYWNLLMYKVYLIEFQGRYLGTFGIDAVK
jgi:hypothetical protein